MKMLHAQRDYSPPAPSEADLEKAWLEQVILDAQKLVNDLKEGYRAGFRPNEISAALTLYDEAADQLFIRVTRLDQYGQDA